MSDINQNVTVRKQKIRKNHVRAKLIFFTILVLILLVVAAFARKLCPYDPDIQDLPVPGFSAFVGDFCPRGVDRLVYFQQSLRDRADLSPHDTGSVAFCTHWNHTDGNTYKLCICGITWNQHRCSSVGMSKAVKSTGTLSRCPEQSA